MVAAMMVLLSVGVIVAALGILAILVLMTVSIAIACFKSFELSAIQHQMKHLSNQDPESVVSHATESEIDSNRLAARSQGLENVETIVLVKPDTPREKFGEDKSKTIALHTSLYPPDSHENPERENCKATKAEKLKTKEEVPGPEISVDPISANEPGGNSSKKEEPNT